MAAPRLCLENVFPTAMITPRHLRKFSASVGISGAESCASGINGGGSGREGEGAWVTRERGGGGELLTGGAGAKAEAGKSTEHPPCERMHLGEGRA